MGGTRGGVPLVGYPLARSDGGLPEVGYPRQESPWLGPMGDTQGGVPPPAGVPQPGPRGGTQGGVSPGRATLPVRSDREVPELDLAGIPPSPHRCGQTENITFPHPSDAVGNKYYSKE